MSRPEANTIEAIPIGKHRSFGNIQLHRDSKESWSIASKYDGKWCHDQAILGNAETVLKTVTRRLAEPTPERTP